MKKILAFSLIELLTVIGIVIILCAIIFPVYQNAKLSALRTERLTHLKQLGIALNLYQTDFDGKVFYGESRPGLSWPELMQPYLKNAKMSINPAYTGKFDGPMANGEGFSVNTCILHQSNVETPNPVTFFETAPLQKGDTSFISAIYDCKPDRINALSFPDFTPMGGKFLTDHDHGGSLYAKWDGSVIWKSYDYVKSQSPGVCTVPENTNGWFATNYK